MVMFELDTNTVSCSFETYMSRACTIGITSRS